MQICLEGKKAIISGSTRGIGYGIAVGLATAGATVLINGRTVNGVTSALERLKLEVPTASVDGCAADLSTAAGVGELISYWPQADVLVNNLGVYGPKPFFEITDDEWDNYIQVNLMSAVRLSRHYAKGMVEQGWGRVLFNASETGGFFPGEMVHYGATKAAVLGLSRGMAESLAGSGVTVNAFLPGPTRTESTTEYMNELTLSSGKTYEQAERELFTAALPTSVLKRFMTPAEVASLVTFLASQQASAITGAALRVDGGIIRSMM